MTKIQPVQPLTVAMGKAQEELRPIEPIRIPRDVSLVMRAARQAALLLDIYGHNLVGDQAYSGLWSFDYRQMMAGIRAVNDAVQAHNDWCIQERLRREGKQQRELLQADKVAARFTLLTVTRRPAWLDQPTRATA